MKKILLLIIAFLVLVFITAYQKQGMSNDLTNQENKDEYLIWFTNKKDARITFKKLKIQPVQSYRNFPIYLTSITPEQLVELKHHKLIISIEKDGDLNSSEVPQNMQYDVFKQYIYTRSEVKYTEKAVSIAILDSGIDSSHMALSVIKEVSFVDTEDSNYSTGHGTHIAGIISRIAPNADLYSVKILNKRNVGKKSSIIAAVDWCITNKIDIVNMSFSFYKNSNIINEVLITAYNRGILLVAAAGNEGAFLKESISFPGAYPSVIAVGSVDQNNERSMFSSVGDSLELMAPGDNIYSTEPNNEYGLRSETSMAAPFVTGVAALIMEENKELSNKEVRNILNNTAQKIGAPFLYGNGLINLEEALLQAGSNSN